MATTSAITTGAVLLGTTETVVLTVPVGEEYNISAIRFTNIDSADRNITVYDYDTGSESASATTTEITTLIQAGSTFEFGPLVLPANRKISAFASVINKISVRVHGWKVVP